MPGLSDIELLAAISAEEQAALGSLRGEIAADRADAIDRYLGKAYGDEITGRSSVVSRDVADVVEGVLANVLKPFVAGDRVVQFNPRGEEDEEAAEQETDYVNFIALERNNGFLCLNSAVKDALLLRNGYVRCGWTKREDVMLETYQGLSDEELALLQHDPAVEIVQHSEYPDPMSLAMMGGVPGQQPGPPSAPEMPLLHDVRVRRKTPIEYVETMPLPCDQILVGERVVTPSLQDADFVQLRQPVTLSYLRQQGYDVDDDISDSDDPETIENFARQRFGLRGDVYDDVTGDPARRIVLFKETYIRIDRDGDGIAELRKVCQVGQNLLDDEETDIVPIACGTGTLMPHQHLGLSIYDMVVDLAKLKTALIRQFMDNKYLANNGRIAVDYNRVNLDDLLISRPGGVVRTDGPPGELLMPLVTPDTGASALQGLEYLDSVRENRTGYTRYAQGMDSDTLVNKTATGLMTAVSQSQMRLEMVARTIAETLVRDLFKIVHAMTLKHANRAEKIRLRNKWVTVDPREWVKRADMSISVGLGVGNSDQQFGKLMALAPMMAQMVQQGLAGPKEVHNFAGEILKTAGFKNPDRFIQAPQIDPQTGQPKMPPPPPNPMLEVEKAKLQMKGQEIQMTAQAKQQQLGMEMQAKQRADQQQLELQKSNDERQAQLDQRKIELQMAADERRHALEQQTELQKAEIQANAAVEVARIKCQCEAQTSQMQMANDQQRQSTEAQQRGPQFDAMNQSLSQLLQAVSAPKKIVRDPMTNRAMGVVIDRGTQQ